MTKHEKNIALTILDHAAYQDGQDIANIAVRRNDAKKWEEIGFSTRL